MTDENLATPTRPLTVPLLFPDVMAKVTADAEKIYQPLLSSSVDDLLPDEPVICFVDEGDGPDDALVLAEHPDLRARAEQTMELQAEVPFTMDLGKKVTAGVFGATAFSASNILSAAQLSAVGELLGSQELWVGIPRGNTMYAVATSHGWEGHQRLMGLLDRVCHNRGDDPHFAESMMVSYTPWRVSQGRVVGPDFEGPDKPKRRLFGR